MKDRRHCLHIFENSKRVVFNIVGSTSSDGLIVAKSAITKQKVVHATLAASTRFKCLQYDVAQPLAREYVPSDYCGVTVGGEDGSRGDDERHRSETALAQTKVT